MSDIEHHAERGGLDATLGSDEFALPTSSGQAAQASYGDCSRSGCDPPAEHRRRGRTTLSRCSVTAW
jgi:hypothetical protein